MVNKTISLSPEMFETLKNEENASALIERLLKNYYSCGGEEKEAVKDEESEKIRLWGRDFVQAMKRNGRTKEELNKFVSYASDSVKFKWGRYLEIEQPDF